MERKQRTLCPICAGSVQEFCAARSVLLWRGVSRERKAEGRQLWAGSEGPSARLGLPGEERRRNSRAREGRLELARSLPAGFKEGGRDGPSVTEKAPIFLMNLHN